MGFELPFIEKQWTKRELLKNMNLDNFKYTESNQIMASYMLIKKTDFTMEFIKDWLLYACNEINITDKFDEKIKQYPEFIEHRHDQSIFSLLYKKYNLVSFGDPSQYGHYSNEYKINKIYIINSEQNLQFRLTENSFLEIKDIIFHYRKGKKFKKKLFKYKIKENMFSLLK